MPSDLKLLGAALLFALLPWTPPAALALGIILLAGQALLIVLVRSGSQPLELTEWALDACLIAPAAWARSSWNEASAAELGGTWLLLIPAAILQLFFLQAMLHHTRAHRQMQRESEERLEMSLGYIQADLDSRILNPERAHENRTGLQNQHLLLQEIFRLGAQTAGLALLQTACLVFSRPTGGLWLAWCLTISLATYLNSKAQDLMLKPYLPQDSRLC
ncbi:MAG: hypothetical protein U0931_34450 [Vulcanimicrobiota bacterium]